MTRTEIVEIVRRIANADGCEVELNELLAQVERAVPHPAVSYLIFNPPNGLELTPEHVVDIALSHEPVRLGGIGQNG